MSKKISLLNHFQDLNVCIINRKSGNIILDVRDNYGFFNDFDAFFYPRKILLTYMGIKIFKAFLNQNTIFFSV